MDVIYHIIVLAVAVTACVRGFRRGLARQTPYLIATAFAIVSTRLLAPGLEPALRGAFPTVHGTAMETFTYDTAATTIVFAAVFLIFSVITSFLSKVFTRDDRTILDNLGGALFSLFEYLTILSICYNVALASDRDPNLMKTVKSDDGNVVEEVLLLAPALLGGEDAAELAHKLQLEDAKKIS
ncbi:MAG: CvpA family protein [Candidatus Amulumruptor caecigallinarius]|nr:CvpA family protein [Candidatus Amulumruptor caecigallinarius]